MAKKTPAEKAEIVAAAVERKRIVDLIETMGRGYYITAQGERYRAVKQILETIERNS